MKKLLSVLLCVLMVTMLVPSAMAAAEFPEKAFDFSESTTVSDYGTVGNTSEASTVTIGDADGINSGKGLVIKKGDSKNVYINFLDPADGANPTAFEVKFNFKFSVNNITMRLVLNQSGDKEVFSAKCNEGVYFLGQTVISANTLTVDTWYDMEMLIDIEQGYGRLKLRENTSDNSKNWSVYHVLASNKDAADSKGGLKGMTYTQRIGIGTLSSAGTVYIDNYSQTLAADVKPALLDAEDFSGEIDTWSKGNLYVNNDESQGIRAGLSFGSTDGVLSMAADGSNSGTNNSSIYKSIGAAVINGAPENTNYIFKFKFGGTSNSNQIGATLGTATNNTETWLIRVSNNHLNMFTGLSGTTTTNANFNSFGEITGDTLYDAEAIYNPTSGVLRVVATNASGKQVSGSATLGGAPTKFAFRNHANSGVASTAYFDDFETGVLTGAPEFVSSTVASGDTVAASLDETVIFTYDRTILQSELAAANVKLNNEVLTNDVDYTITSKGNQVMVTLKDLAKNTDYTVELTGVKDLAEAATEETATATFHTAAKDIEAEKPVLDNTTLSAKVYSWYAQGKKVKLIAALYNAEGTKLENVAVKEFTVKDRNGETISHNFSDVFSADGKKMGFVWSDFDTMVPYAEAYK